MRFIRLVTILVVEEYLTKTNNLPKRHGVGPPEDPHRLHGLKAGPAPTEPLKGSLSNCLHF